jgi:hypothetical protein
MGADAQDQFRWRKQEHAACRPCSTHYHRQPLKISPLPGSVCHVFAVGAEHQGAGVDSVVLGIWMNHFPNRFSASCADALPSCAAFRYQLAACPTSFDKLGLPFSNKRPKWNIPEASPASAAFRYQIMA